MTSRCFMCGRYHDDKTPLCNSCTEWVKTNTREPTAEDRRDHLKEWTFKGYDEDDGSEIYRYE